MLLPSILGHADTALRDMQANEMLEVNEQLKNYGLVLTAEQAKEIIDVRNGILQNCGRIELSIDVTKKFLESFCSSSLISPEDFVSTVHELHEIFYYMKNETEDSVGDDELIEIIRDLFNNSCQGSLELLKGRELGVLVERFRHKGFIGYKPVDREE